MSRPKRAECKDLLASTYEPSEVEEEGYGNGMKGWYLYVQTSRWHERLPKQCHYGKQIRSDVVVSVEIESVK